MASEIDRAVVVTGKEAGWRGRWPGLDASAEGAANAVAGGVVNADGYAFHAECDEAERGRVRSLSIEPCSPDALAREIAAMLASGAERLPLPPQRRDNAARAI